MTSIIGRPPKKAGELYGTPQPERIHEYVEETVQTRWTQPEITILVKFAGKKTIPELSDLLPNRTDLQIRRMMERLSS